MSSYVPIDSYSDRDETLQNLKIDNSNVFRRVQRRTSSTCLYIYAIVVTILFCISLISHLGSWQWQLSSTNARQIQANLGRNETYMMLDHQYDELWDNDLTGGKSVLVIPNEDGSPWSEDGSPALIAMFHQLHCVAGLRKALQDQQDGKDIGDFHTNKHWPHCFDYIRRTILCWADSTFERPEKLPNGSIAAPLINGAMGMRTCQEKESLFELMRTAKRYND